MMDKTAFFQEAKNIWDDISFKLDRDSDEVIAKLYRTFFKKTGLDSRYNDLMVSFCNVLDGGGLNLFRAANSRNVIEGFDSVSAELGKKFEEEDVALSVETVGYIFGIDFKEQRRKEAIQKEKEIEERKSKSRLLQTLESYVESKRLLSQSIENFFTALVSYRDELGEFDIDDHSDYYHDEMMDCDDPEKVKEHLEGLSEKMALDGKAIREMLQKSDEIDAEYIFENSMNSIRYSDYSVDDLERNLLRNLDYLEKWGEQRRELEQHLQDISSAPSESTRTEQRKQISKTPSTFYRFLNKRRH
jgi:hypothetical protein